jgi:hypothetical protein
MVLSASPQRDPDHKLALEVSGDQQAQVYQKNYRTSKHVLSALVYPLPTTDSRIQVAAQGHQVGNSLLSRLKTRTATLLAITLV